ncbi:PHD finger protein ING [Rhynchospora pubera]|uniref:PHD finger protein ING n=1 Tax=Rhynchospora pubera TaxID=906938 RepID=A0AAV8E213_9POAL|nr:PHD finger protein ING [Rhynchospora pubera]KAJ4777544.1 PHD finger protein ING [Rhynchospora pubera]KAJ4803246.1 PHD finger protein ING [Rhynchospora pubera]
MGFIDDFVASLESLPAMLERNYKLMRDLDKSLHYVQAENEHRCGQELEEFKLGVESGRIPITSDPSKIKFSEEALEEQSHCVRIADEKVALATQAYDMVDAHIQQLDQYMRRLEEIRQEKELAASAAAAAASPSIGTGPSTSNINVVQKSGRSGERGRGGRKKSRLTADPVVPPIDLELPVDPNEPTYCLCNQVSYGEMVACDNANCKIEWFHFGCVGLKEQPKGKWYCNDCATLLKRKKGSSK